MIQGAIDALANGLRCPDKVMASTKEYRESEDALTAFVEQKVIPGTHIITAELRARYNQFCKGMGAEPLNATNLTVKLKQEHGVQKDVKNINGKTHRVYLGIGLEAEDQEP
jgi:putative DNA primase/helicase